MDNRVDKKVPTFFMKLQNFCNNTQNEYAAINKSLNSSNRSSTYKYNSSMKSILSEVDELKKQNESVKQKMASIFQFEHFVNSLQDLIEAQGNDIDVMEKYLEKFGYNIPHELKYVIPTETEDKETPQKINNQPDEESQVALPVSPPLDHQKHTDLKTGEASLKTPRTKEAAWYATPTPNVSTKQKVANWMESVDNNFSFADTPFGSKIHSRRHDQHNPVKVVEQKLDFDQEESDLCTSNHVNTSETDSFSKHEMESKIITSPSNKTPEFTAFSTEMAGKIGDMDSSKCKRNTPEFPSFSDLGQTLMKCSDNTQNQHTPEEPHLQNDPMEQGRGHELPPSPQLSDITLSILNKLQ